MKRAVRPRLTLSTFLVIALSLVTGSCGRDEPRVDSPIQPYLDQFFREAQARGIKANRNVAARIVDEDLRGEAGEKLIAQCELSPARGGPPLVSVTHGFWYAPETDDVARKTTVFHELGHCVLGRGHVKETAHLSRSNELAASAATSHGSGTGDFAAIEIPVSLMHPTALATSDSLIREHYMKNEHKYIDELFGLIPRVAAD